MLCLFGSSGCDKESPPIAVVTDRNSQLPRTDNSSKTPPSAPKNFALVKREGLLLSLHWDASQDNRSKPEQIRYLVLYGANSSLAGAIRSRELYLLKEVSLGTTEISVELAQEIQLPVYLYVLAIDHERNESSLSNSIKIDPISSEPPKTEPANPEDSGEDHHEGTDEGDEHPKGKEHPASSEESKSTQEWTDDQWVAACFWKELVLYQSNHGVATGIPDDQVDHVIESFEKFSCNRFHDQIKATDDIMIKVLKENEGAIPDEIGKKAAICFGLQLTKLKAAGEKDKKDLLKKSKLIIKSRCEKEEIKKFNQDLLRQVIENSMKKGTEHEH